MSVKELEEKLALLKMDYVRLQGDVEKIESIGGNVRPSGRQMRAIEDEIKLVRQQIREAEAD